MIFTFSLNFALFFEGDMMKEVDLYSMIEKIGDKLYACKACEYKSIRRNAVKRHLLSKHQQLNIECSNCLKVYKNQRGYDRHSCVRPQGRSK